MGKNIGFLWIFCLIVFFGIGVIELVVLPAVQYNLVPVLKLSANTTLSASDQIDFNAKIDQTMNFMKYGMYTVMFVLLVYLVLSLFTREDNEFYQP